MKLLDAARDDWLFALYVLAVTTGMRQVELLALRWADIDMAPGLSMFSTSCRVMAART